MLPDAAAPVADALQKRHAARLAVEAANRATANALEALAHEGFAFQRRRDHARPVARRDRGSTGPPRRRRARAAGGDREPAAADRPITRLAPVICLVLCGRSSRVLTVVNDEEIIGRIDAYCDAVPRERARAEEIGPLVLFVPVGPGFPYYARPRAGDRGPVTAADVRAVRARQRELKLPESFEWIEHSAPEMAAAAAAAGLRVHAHPLLVLGTLAPSPAAAADASVRHPGRRRS